MKKKLIFAPIACTLLLAPAVCSCGHAPQFNELTEETYNEALNQFVGEDYAGGICSIPHGSYELDQIETYLINKIKEFGIAEEKIKHDYYGNIWYDIDASSGCEDWKPLVMQAHTDMVWTLKAGLTPEETPTHPEPIEDIVNGEPVIHTEGYKSSLGADDGSGISAILAITKLRNKIPHGKIRCIFSADEEPGLVGAEQIGWMDEKHEVDRINPVDHEEGWDYLLNIDSENEEEMYVSCSGAYSHEYTFNNFGAKPLDEDWDIYELNITGGKGGHSALGIKENLVNTIKLGSEMLTEIDDKILIPYGKCTIRLISIECGETASNVIPKAAKIIFGSQGNKKNDMLNEFKEYVVDKQAKVLEEHPNDKDIKLDISLSSQFNNANQTPNALSVDSSGAILKWINNTYCGLLKSDPIDGRPISSSNLCPLTLDLTKAGDQTNPQFDAKIYSRSEDLTVLNMFQSSAIVNYQTMVEEIHEETQPESNDIKLAEYEPYVYNEDDTLRAMVVTKLENVNIKPKFEKIHGGIECSWWYKYNHFIQQATIGPNTFDVHSPQEILYLNSYKKIISTILDTIQGMQEIE